MIEYTCTKEIFFWLTATATIGGVLIGLWFGELLNKIKEKRLRRLK